MHVCNADSFAGFLADAFRISFAVHITAPDSAAGEGDRKAGGPMIPEMRGPVLPETRGRFLSVPALDAPGVRSSFSNLSPNQRQERLSSFLDHSGDYVVGLEDRMIEGQARARAIHSSWVDRVCMGYSNSRMGAPSLLRSGVTPRPGPSGGAIRPLMRVGQSGAILGPT